MRNNQNRHSRGRRNSNHSRRDGGNNQRRGGNSRSQIFDSNGPDIRVRGNAAQVTEKYTSLARDAAAAGDNILAESYYQHAEHYQRILNETNEARARYQQQREQQQADANGQSEQPAMEDLDQGFLVGDKKRGNGSGKKKSDGEEATEKDAAVPPATKTKEDTVTKAVEA